MDKFMEEMEYKRVEILKQFGIIFLQKHMEEVQKDTPELLKQLNEISDEMWKYRKKKADERGMLICPVCYKELTKDSLYCNQCGSKVDNNINPYISQKKEKICPKCGKKADEGEGQKFCIKCGTALD